MNFQPSFHADAILKRLQQEKIQWFYHWTNIDNLPGFRKMRALCSKQTLQNMVQWPPPKPGGNELSHSLDRRHDNWDKVSLNLTPYTPMAYHKKRENHLCFFIVKPQIAAWQGVIFTDTNATSNSHRRSEGLDGLNLVRFDAIRSAPRPWDKDGWHQPVQAEVLVPNKIPLSYVERVAFVSKTSLAEGLRLWGSSDHPQFEEAPGYFADGPGQISSIGFAHLTDLILTDAHVNKDNVSHRRVHRVRFLRIPGGRITAIMKVHALTGTRARAKWEPVGIETTTEFQTSNDYWYWSSVLMDRLPDGLCCIECYLNDIRWAQINFELVPS